MTHEDIRAGIEAFIRRRFAVPPADPYFARDVHLWEHGYVDSSGAVELIMFVENTFHVALPEDVLFDPSFATIDGIAELVERARGAAVSAGAA